MQRRPGQVLELLQDRRSGIRLEVVIPTFNEERRIGNLLRYYGGEYDLVLLDGGSYDGTLTLARTAGVTVFKRLGEASGDQYVVHYINEVTRSGLCFYLCADQFIERTQLARVEQELRCGATAVLCDKAEWVYGRRMRTFNHTEAHGFCKGCAHFDADNLHEALRVAPEAMGNVCPRRYELHHFHLWSVRDQFGKIALYSEAEIGGFRRRGRAGWRFFRRYVASLIGFPLAKLWRERGISPSLAVYWILRDLAELSIAGMSWLEQAYLIGPEEQLARYAHFYREPQE